MRLSLANLIILGAWAMAPCHAEPLRLGEPQTQQWQIGMIVEAPGACSGIQATLPVPTDWPEQQVAEVARETTEHVTTLSFRTLAGGVKQMVIMIPRLPAGDTARALVTFKITKRNIVGPADGRERHAPAKLSSEWKLLYLGVSPSIETTHPEIQRLAAEIVAGKQSDWDKAEAIYDWVREKIKYKFDEQLQTTLTALKRGEGDCEELTSLFIAFCRNQGIPARSVWVPGHCYPEFYLEQADGQGCWFPCQAAGTREFGAMHEARPILQKGDRFTVPGDSKLKRYVAETFAAKNAAAPPRVQFIRRPLTAPGEKRAEAGGPFGPQ